MLGEGLDARRKIRYWENDQTLGELLDTSEGLDTVRRIRYWEKNYILGEG